MADDKLDFLDESEATEVETVEEVEVEAQAEAETPEEVAEETGEPEDAAPPVADREDSKSIPITALLDEREKRQEAQRRAEAAERRIAEIERRMSQKPQEVPDFYEDPDRRLQYEQHNIQQVLTKQKLEQSRFFAEKEYGADTVQAAYDYFDKHPQMTREFIGQPSPFHAAVAAYKRMQVVEEIGEDPDGYKAQLREQVRQEVMQELQTSKPSTPPPSMATAKATGVNAKPKGNAFDEVFPD